jgi:hypothetical protein
MRAARLLIFFPTLFLIAFSCVAAPRPQQVHLWDSQVDSLASKIAANLEKTDAISFAVTNISSLNATAVAEIRAGLEKNLQKRGLRLDSSSVGEASVEVALSENLYESVWAAKIRRGESERVAIVSFPRAASLPNASPATAISLQRQIVWQESARILDFAVLSDTEAGGTALVTLEPLQLVLHENINSHVRLSRAFRIPQANTHPPRGLRGKIDLASETAELPGIKCTGVLEQLARIQCVDAPDIRESTSSLGGKTNSIGGRSVEAVTLGGACGMDSLLVASGTGDWTVPDTIRAYTETDHQLTPLGNTLEIPGPVNAMWPADDSKSARVISRNLQTGMYEASIVSVACNR